MENIVIKETFSAEDTFKFGENIGSKAVPGQVITLTGDLGTGKTVFVQGLARGLGIDDYINSPTFTIVQIYESGRLPLYHFDVYRIEDESEMYETGLDDYMYGEGVCVIEWAEMISGLLPEERTEILIEKDLEKGFDYRRITVKNRQN
ncbi:MAG: tRNA (adenosine(37)-N6)-threonylcarbamoyltransferase complex ATPase subunit type 1 TsaE [Lachnospiraceae bacterium]|nr:tRNA (adenosine(37)-N6)-threonylcarbamoyltransferase complex ATPase subunit type 1 TsaE [Lachnospiraceae bacterium]MCR5633856.1 tRNA (adenosine(37)-N6)-threonylcarbamoyltransferase complex ATPase subunit type 1 TsaE [Lachnospiraceae bacterium]